MGTNSGYFITTTTGGAITNQQKAGNITTDGKVGTSANKPLITTTKGVVTTGSFGTSANSFCEGNDSRLSDARTPLAHTHDLDDITDYMVTSISCSDYNPTIDGTVTVTVFVGDSEGVGIQGVSVPVTASVGNFTQLNGVTITASSSVTGITGANGTFTLTYACSEWGLITFSANNTNNQINVVGWKEVFRNTTNDPKIQVFRNATHCRLKFSAYTVSSMNTTWVQYGSTAFLNDWKPSQAVTFIGYDYTFLLRVAEDGKLYWRTVTGTLSNKNLYGQYEWSIA